MTFKVEKGIPLPPSVKGVSPGECPYPFADMEVGDSFQVLAAGEREQKIARQKTSAWAKRMRQRGMPGFRITSRSGDGFVRIWRMEDGETTAYAKRAPKTKAAKSTETVETASGAKIPVLKGNSTPDSYMCVQGKKIPVMSAR